MKVKQYHPDVNKDNRNCDAMIRQVIQAYEVKFFKASHPCYDMISVNIVILMVLKMQILSQYSRSEIIER